MALADQMKVKTSDLLFEVGVEEMPSGPLNSAITQIERTAAETFAAAGLTYRDLTVYSTPRRLALCVRDLLAEQPDSSSSFRGPASSLAFDESGAPTPAGAGFAKGKGVDPADLRREIVDGVEYVFADVHNAGKPTAVILPDLLSALVDGLEFKRTQRWGSTSHRFIRPIRWVVALFDHAVLPVTIAGIEATNQTMGHRFLTKRPIELATMGEYVRTMRTNSVVVDPGERRAMIIDRSNVAAEPYGSVLIVENVLDEVVNLTELPTAIVGTFDESFLRVPREILEYAMSKHQRYFAIERSDGTLDNHFVVISNGSPARNAEIVRGHERVVRARLSDAAFFFDEDRKVSLDEFRDRLSGVVFQEKLGTLLDKSERIEWVAVQVAAQVGLEAAESTITARAAHLCKADLVSSAVVEFTEVQGTMGGHYARLSGEAQGVATAIAEHYRPRYSGDTLPSTPAGRLVAVADKIDTIVGIFAAGKAPRGTSDPFALRRAAIGVIQIALDPLPLGATRLDLAVAVNASLDSLGPLVGARDEIRDLVLDFFKTRLETILRDRGLSYDTVSAVLPVAGGDPADALARGLALEEFRSEGEDIADLSTAYTRAKNLSDTSVGTDVDGALLEGVERDLASVLDSVSATVSGAISSGSYREALTALASTRTAVDAFFEGVMVLADDPAVRRNRLALLNRFLSLFGSYADFSALVAR